MCCWPKGIKMKRTIIEDALKLSAIGQDIKIQGFVDSIRNQKYVQFLILRDQQD
jgi:aspartyl/asparaginyl-tRNA synthetase